MEALRKVRQYMLENGKTVADLKEMGKAAVVLAAGLTYVQARGLFKAYKRYKAEQAIEDNLAKLANITAKIRNGTLPAKPTAVVEEIEPGISYKVTI